MEAPPGSFGLLCPELCPVATGGCKGDRKAGCFKLNTASPWTGIALLLVGREGDGYPSRIQHWACTCWAPGSALRDVPDLQQIGPPPSLEGPTPQPCLPAPITRLPPCERPSGRCQSNSGRACHTPRDLTQDRGLGEAREAGSVLLGMIVEALPHSTNMG